MLGRHVAPIAAVYLVAVDGLDSENNEKNRGIFRNLLSRHNQTTKLDYYQHDPKEFDYYVKNPTVDDLPILLRKFDDEGQDVWPWVWTHPNENGPHYVFVGMTAASVRRIQELRRQSAQNNILVVASEEILNSAAKDAGVDSSVYNECHCGIVTDADLQLLHVKSKILMLDDERIIAFDYLTIC